ncbi:MAG: serine/threonine protein kinase [Planctomycetes bacterium]|nr:serine/threonine protein kinase [Planctomycetota bacterium]
MEPDESTTKDTASLSGDVSISERGQRDPSELQIGERIDHYIIRQKLGEGGFAIVYLAEQTEPVTRRVALKIIKPGMDSRQVIARFEAERQALAKMSHPHVARIFDAGSTEAGRPYFVMELVPGEPITDYCDRHRLTTAQRLELFKQTCEAVQHAHQKAIIHRDIKPSNVLVTVLEGKPNVKVIDFGVAKAIEHRLTEQTIYTEQGQLIGTPEYMSPEQAEMGALDIDTRTDIYSLGVLLYELLTGSLPFDPKSLRKAGLAEIQRIIREEEPPRPSTRLTSMDEKESSSVAKLHHVDRRSLSREIRGELDAITMKALAKDRSLRYGSASEFAADAERYINGEPVLARAPGRYYRLRRRLRKHRGVLSATAAVLAIASFVATQFIVQMDRRSSQHRIAQQLVFRLADLQAQTHWYGSVVRELTKRNNSILLKLTEQIDSPPDTESAFHSDPNIRDAIELLHLIFVEISMMQNRVFWWEKFMIEADADNVEIMRRETENMVREVTSEVLAKWASREGISASLEARLGSVTRELVRPPITATSRDIAAALLKDYPDSFEDGAKAFLTYLKHTLEYSLNPTLLDIDEIDMPALDPVSRNVTFWDEPSAYPDLYRNIQNKRPESLSNEELAQANYALAIDIRQTSSASPGIGSPMFPWWWYWSNIDLMILAVFAGGFTLFAISLWII